MCWILKRKLKTSSVASSKKGWNLSTRPGYVESVMCNQQRHLRATTVTKLNQTVAWNLSMHLWRAPWWHQCVIRGNSFDDKGWLGETEAMPVAREPILVLEIVLFSIERIIWIMLNLKVTKCNIIKFHWFLKCLICIMQPATWFVYWQCNVSRWFCVWYLYLLLWQLLIM